MTTKKEKLGVPSEWSGSAPEYLVYNSLVNTFKKREGIDFTYQSAFMGGRLDKGGVVLDFVFADPPDLAINVQGEYYHYGMGVTFIQNDIIVRQQMAGQGIHLIFIDESDILEDVDYYLREAFNYKDHSQIGGGS
tara:strand:- start:389 stop:793 length:405 start_codon:yes stop_codon:yes gene_type:complete